MIAIIIVLTAAITGMNIYQKQQYASENNKVEEEQVEVGKVEVDEQIYDDCTDEGEMIADNQKETLQVNSNYEKEDNKEYVLRDNEGVIAIYKINEEGKEELYDITDVATAYLAKQDQESLLSGIKVQGVENLNQLLEDFE